MKRFTFRLERLRELRERAERERAAALGLAMREQSERELALEHARRELWRAGEQAATAAGGRPWPAGMLHNLERARDAAGERVDAALEALREASEAVARERDRYDEARRELRVIEKLKSMRLEAWRAETAREEQKETDGVALSRHAAKEERQ